MKVEFEDSFGKSLKRLIWHESRIYKFYSIFRYGIWHFFANLWRFRKVLWNHQWWDYRYHLEAIYTSLSIMETGLHKGIEVAESRDKKIQKMQRALELLKNKMDDNYIDRAELVLGDLVMHDWEFEEVPDHPGCSRLVDNDTPEETEHNRKVFNYSTELEQNEWAELWDIYKGKLYADYADYKKVESVLLAKCEADGLDAEKIAELTAELHNSWFDGSGANTWWD